MQTFWTYEIHGEVLDLQRKTKDEAQEWADDWAFENNAHGEDIFLLEFTDTGLDECVETQRIASCAGEEMGYVKPDTTFNKAQLGIR